jgi:hypothetical protein
MNIGDELPKLQRIKKTFKRVLFSPSEFFASMPTEGNLGAALTYGLVTHWIGAGAVFLWEWIGGDSIEDTLSRLQLMDRFKEPGIQAFFKFGILLADPLLTAFSILFSSATIYVAVRLFVDAGRDGAPRQLRFETLAKILGYSYLPSVFLLVPFIGFPIMYLWSFFIVVQGVRAVYHVSKIRSLVIVLFPAFLMGGLLLLGFLGLLVLGFKLLGSFF